jgi:Ca2+-binding RTX toxin-like protein
MDSQRDGLLAATPGLDGDGSVLVGGAGNDLVIGGGGHNLMVGGFGFDRFEGSQERSATAETAAGKEALWSALTGRSADAAEAVVIDQLFG